MKKSIEQVKKMIPEISAIVGRELSIWTKNGHARLYVNRNKFKSYGYIDLNTWTKFGIGNQVSVDQVFELISK